jgi:hypothetical protein
MKTQSNTLVKVYGTTSLVIIPLIAAAWFTPPDFPMLLRQVLLGIWGVGATLVAERLLFSRTWRRAWQAIGFVPARLSTLGVALLVSLPMWLFLPLLAWLNNTPIQLRPDWLALVLGVILVNGLALPPSFLAWVLVPYMGVVLVSIYLIFVLA